MKLRLIPLVIAAAVLLLGVKISDLWSALDARAATEQATSRVAQAGAPAADPAEANSETEPAVLASPAGAKSKEAAALAADPLMMSPSEIEVLQKLSERRAGLDRRAQEMAQQEVVLKAAEQRVEEKLAKLKSIEQEIGGLVDQEVQQGNDRLKGLVKIYETMKPREAARIFEELETPTVLDVLEHMKEAKAAPILASMDPVKAKGVTAGLIERRQQVGKPAAKTTSP
jgi:flagellar motility protein MotE (MotC chaperone)